MRKIFLWIKKHVKCWNEGYDYFYREVFGVGYFVCKRCGKVSKDGVWAKEE